MAARRAVVRWAWRMFRREWRQQLLVVTLLTVAVAAAVGSITIASNAVPADNSDFGSADQVLRFDASDPGKLRAGLDAARTTLGTIDTIGHLAVPVPGSVDRVDYRSQAPGGTYTGELLALRRGSYPAGPAQAAVTNGVADSLRLELGSTVALDGRRRTVVGIVENPEQLSDEFVLVSPSSARPDQVDVFARTGIGSLNAFQDAQGPGSGFRGVSLRGSDVSSAAETLAIFSVATVFLLLASLVAAAGFAVVAQRRLRQLGMLAAVGATQRHVRLVLLANGVLVGAVAALTGTIAGLLIWAVFAPMLEPAVDHRIDRLGLPWGLLVLTGALAIAGAAVSAWWPGRAVSRLPIVAALSGRPPEPRPARHSAIAAAALISVGIGALALSNRDEPALIIGGLVATILGSLLLGPPAIRAFSALAGRAPIAPRLALRDLARYQARSGAALAAVTLALGIAATVVVTASAQEAKDAREPANLSDRQLRLYMGPEEDRKLTPVEQPARLHRLAAGARRVAAQLERGTLTPLHKAVEPGAAPLVAEGARYYAPIELTRQVATGDGRRSYRSDSELYVATPAVLAYLGIEPASVDPRTDFLVDRGVEDVDELVIPTMKSRRVFAVGHVQRINARRQLFGGASGRMPPSFITLNGLRRHGWAQVPGGWLVGSSRPLTGAQIAEARRVAADAGLTIESRQRTTPATKVLAIATAAGAVLALAILALTVGLIRGESSGDLRTLSAAGATARIRRTLTATTAGALALLGALLGVAGAYVALAATYYDDLGYLGDVPVRYLALAVLGVPLAAAAAGWLVAGREPPAIARAVLD